MILREIPLTGQRAMLVAVVVGAAILTVSASNATAAQESPEHQRYVYANPGGVELEALVIEPDSDNADRPAIVIAHGGGWAIGEASWGLGRAQFFADLGLVAISIQYRLSSPEAGVTPLEAMADTRAAIRWVRRHAEDLGIAPNRVAGYGWSAGAHLLVSAAIFGGGNGDGKEELSSALDTLILASPAVSLSDSSWVREILAGRAAPADISPDVHVRSGLPPTLLLQGRTDTVTPLVGTEAFHEAMLTAGNSSELIVYDGVGHLFTPSSEPDDDWPNPDPEVSAASLVAMEEFLRAQGFVADSETGAGRHPAAAPELAALEFLIGDWDLTTSFAQPDGTRRQASARLTARYALGGFGISVEETHGYEEGAGGQFISNVLYVVHPETRRLVGSSNNTLGNRKDYDVTVEGERVVIVQSGDLFDGRQGFNRLVLFDVTPNRYELRLDVCSEDGESCSEGTYSYVAERRPSTETTPSEGQRNR